MKLPKTFLIKGHQWRLEYKWNLRDAQGEKLNGEADLEKRVIRIDRLLDKDTKFRTFLHEILHAGYKEAHLHEAGGIDGIVEEISIETSLDVILSLFSLRFKRVSK